MPNVSERGTIMPASPIRRLAPLATDAKARGIKVYHLNIGQPDVPTPPAGLEVLKHIDRNSNAIVKSQNTDSLFNDLCTITHTGTSDTRHFWIHPL